MNANSTISDNPAAQFRIAGDDHPDLQVIKHTPGSAQTFARWEDGAEQRKTGSGESGNTPAGFTFPDKLLSRSQQLHHISTYPEQDYDPADCQIVKPMISSKDPEEVISWLENNVALPQDRSIGLAHRLQIEKPSQAFLDMYGYTPWQWETSDGRVRRPLKEDANYVTGHLLHLHGGWYNQKVVGCNTALVGNQGLDMEKEEAEYARICAMRGVDYSQVAFPYPEIVAFLQGQAHMSKYRTVTKRDYSSPYDSTQRSPQIFYNPTNKCYEAYPENSVASSASQIAQMMHRALLTEQAALEAGGHAEIALKFKPFSLLGGPPGSGKTTWVDAIAANLGLPVIHAAMNRHMGENLASDGLFCRSALSKNSSELLITNIAAAYVSGGIVRLDEVGMLTDEAKHNPASDAVRRQDRNRAGRHA